MILGTESTFYRFPPVIYTPGIAILLVTALYLNIHVIKILSKYFCGNFLTLPHSNCSQWQKKTRKQGIEKSYRPHHEALNRLPPNG